MKKVIFLMVVLSIMLVGSNVYAEAGLPIATVYGWNGTSWMKAVVDGEGHFIVQTDTDSIIRSILNTVTTYMTLSQYNGIIDKFVEQYVLTSTASETMITRLDTINTELIEHYVLISSGNETIITRLDTMNDELIEHYVLSSTNTAAILSELISAYVLTSTGTEAIIDRLDSLIGGVTVYITESQVADLKIVTLPDGTTVYLTENQFNAIVDEFQDVVISSGADIRPFQVDNATGTILIISSTTVTTWTLQTRPIEIITEADEDNTDNIRWRYYNEQVQAAGNKLHPGDVWIHTRWTGTGIYFTAEAGAAAQTLIIQEIYE